jgi:5,10-methylenetetrahydrofolate reductase
MPTFLERLKSSDPLIGVELRPPRADLEHASSMDAWLEMHSAVSRLANEDTALFFTDNAVGTLEEESLHHLVSNLEEYVARMRICPFLTTKHSLEYCLWFAARALDNGHSALTVLGGDRTVGPPRCLPHSGELRQRIRERHPSLALGGWANPHHGATEQTGYLMSPDATVDFYLTQIVSHHQLQSVERFVEATRHHGLEAPGVFGVFYYRSANPRTFRMLSEFIPVPAEQITRDFRERRLTPDEICANTIRALRGLGIDRVYISNLQPDHAPDRLAAIRELVER